MFECAKMNVDVTKKQYGFYACGTKCFTLSFIYFILILIIPLRKVWDSYKKAKYMNIVLIAYCFIGSFFQGILYQISLQFKDIGLHNNFDLLIICSEISAIAFENFKTICNNVVN